MIRLLLRVGNNPLLHKCAGDAITIGRASTNHVMIRDLRVSRLHARIERIGNALQVVDLQSGNGTRLNGERIESDHLRVGDALQIGPTSLRIEEIDVSREARTGVLPAGPRIRLRARARRLRRPG